MEDYNDLLQRINRVSKSVVTGNLQCSVGGQNLIVWRDNESYNDLRTAIETMIADWPFANTLNLYVEYQRPAPTDGEYESFQDWYTRGLDTDRRKLK